MRPRWAIRASLIAAACTVPLGVAACGASHQTPAGAPGQAAGAVQPTPAQARAAFGQILVRFQAAQSTHDRAAELAVATGSEAVAPKHLPALAFGPSVPALTGIRVYVPQLASYPRWFLATGHAAAYPISFLFVLRQASRGAPWLVASELYGVPGYGKLPDLSGIAVNRAGYASTVPVTDTTLAVAPGQISGVIASDFNAALASAPGATPGYSNPVVGMDRSAMRLAPRYGWRVFDRLRSARFPVYALRTSDRGAVVIYATAETFGWLAASAHATLTAPRAAVYATAAPDPRTVSMLHLTMAAAGLRISYSVLDQHVTIDPPGAGQLVDYLTGQTLAITSR